MAGAMRRKEANRWAAQPPRAIERTGSLPTPPTTCASPPGERSIAAPRRTSPSEAQAEAGRTALGALLGDKASAEGGSCNWAPKCNDGRPGARRPCLSVPCPRVHSAHAAGLWPATLGQHPEESDPVNPRQPARHCGFGGLGSVAFPPHNGGVRRLDRPLPMHEVIDEPRMHRWNQDKLSVCLNC